uniref:Uncharacterized protein n=1 Tax=Arundo donax TaxID=35708 RepID=A0A0A9CU51_ARUDO
MSWLMLLDSAWHRQGMDASVETFDKPWEQQWPTLL